LIVLAALIAAGIGFASIGFWRARGIDSRVVAQLCLIGGLVILAVATICARRG
jgi:hypothetical protein